MLARYFGRDPMGQYPEVNISEARQENIDSAAFAMFANSRRWRHLLTKWLEILRLLDVLLSRAG